MRHFQQLHKGAGLVLGGLFVLDGVGVLGFVQVGPGQRPIEHGRPQAGQKRRRALQPVGRYALRNGGRAPDGGAVAQVAQPVEVHAPARIPLRGAGHVVRRVKHIHIAARHLGLICQALPHERLPQVGQHAHIAAIGRLAQRGLKGIHGNIRHGLRQHLQVGALVLEGKQHMRQNVPRRRRHLRGHRQQPRRGHDPRNRAHPGGLLHLKGGQRQLLAQPFIAKDGHFLFSASSFCSVLVVWTIFCHDCAAGSAIHSNPSTFPIKAKTG